MMLNQYEHESSFYEQGIEVGVLLSFNYYHYTRTIKITDMAIWAGRSWFQVSENEMLYRIETQDLQAHCEEIILEELIDEGMYTKNYKFNRLM